MFPGHYWAVDPTCEFMFEEGSFRRRPRGYKNRRLLAGSGGQSNSFGFPGYDNLGSLDSFSQDMTGKSQPIPPSACSVITNQTDYQPYVPTPMYRREYMGHSGCSGSYFVNPWIHSNGYTAPGTTEEQMHLGVTNYQSYPFSPYSSQFSCAVTQPAVSVQNFTSLRPAFYGQAGNSVSGSLKQVELPTPRATRTTVTPLK